MLFILQVIISFCRMYRAKGGLLVKLDKRTIRKIILWTIGAPILVNILMFIPSFGLAATTTDNWLGFFGNFSGGIIGGIVAFIIASNQIKSQNELMNQSEIENSRSYIILEEFIAPINLEKVITHNNSKILTNKYYEEVKKGPSGMGKNIPFYKIHHSGLPEIILDIEIKVILFGEKNDQEIDLSPYLVQTHISVLEKNTEIFIPVVNKEFNFIYPKRVTVSYSTIKNEKIIYIYDIVEKEEKHILINFEDRTKDKVLHSVHIKGVEWLYPAKFSKK